MRVPAHPRACKRTLLRTATRHRETAHSSLRRARRSGPGAGWSIWLCYEHAGRYRWKRAHHATCNLQHGRATYRLHAQVLARERALHSQHRECHVARCEPGGVRFGLQLRVIAVQPRVDLPGANPCRASTLLHIWNPRYATEDLESMQSHTRSARARTHTHTHTHTRTHAHAHTHTHTHSSRLHAAVRDEHIGQWVPPGCTRLGITSTIPRSLPASQD